MNPRTPPDTAPAVTLDNQHTDRPAGAPAPRHQAHLPHERDQHPHSQQTPQAPNHEVGQQAFSDVSHGLVDTDEGLRKSSVDRGQARPAQPAGPVTAPRQASPGAADGQSDTLPQRGRPLAPR